MADVCRFCQMLLSAKEPRVKVDAKGESWVFHPEHLRAALHRALKVFKEAGLKVESRQFRELETAQQAVQAIVDNLLGASVSESETVTSLASIWILARVNLYFTPKAPEPIAQLIEQMVAACLVPKSPKKPLAKEPEPEPRAVKPPESPIKAVFEAGFSSSSLEAAKAALPQLRADMLAIAQCHLQVVWDPSQLTGSTDCLGQAWLNPYYYETGLEELGRGIGYHEAGHCRWSRFGREAIGLAQKEGQEILVHLVNLILDRHDDELTAKEAPGFAPVLRERLSHLFPGHRGVDPWQDFAFACKKRTRPRFRETAQAMRIVKKFIRSGEWTAQGLLETAKAVRQVLRQYLPPAEIGTGERGLVIFMTELEKIEMGPELTGAQRQELEKAACGLLHRERRTEVKRLQQILQSSPGSSGSQTRPTTGGTWAHEQKILKPEIVKVNGVDLTTYAANRRQVARHLHKLLAAIARVDSPVETTLRFQEEGEVDPLNLARLVSGFRDCLSQTIVESDLDAEIHLALDQSSSMADGDIEYAKLIGVLFNEAVCHKKPYLDGYLWGYNQEDKPTIYEYGQCRIPSPVVMAKADGCNADYEMLRVIAQRVQRSQRKRKIVIMVGDEGPSNPKEVNRLAEELLAQGIPVIHIMVGIFAAPQIFPIQLLFRSFPEFMKEFGDFLTKMLSWLK